jgi:hypothetical protein
MTDTVLYSENNYFSINLFKNKKVNNKLNLKCIIASDNGIDNSKKWLLINKDR